MKARAPVQAALGGIDGDGIEPYDPDRINLRISILDNLLFGRINTRRMHAEADIRDHVLMAVRRFDLEEWIERRGLDFRVGNRGQLLTDDQRAKIELARAAITLPSILVVEEAGFLDQTSINFLASPEWSARRTSLVLFTSSVARATALDTRITLENRGNRQSPVGSSSAGAPGRHTRTSTLHSHAKLSAKGVSSPKIGIRRGRGSENRDQLPASGD